MTIKVIGAAHLWNSTTAEFGFLFTNAPPKLSKLYAFFMIAVKLLCTRVAVTNTVMVKGQTKTFSYNLKSAQASVFWGLSKT